MKHPCSLCGSRDWPNPDSDCPLCRPSRTLTPADSLRAAHAITLRMIANVRSALQPELTPDVFKTVPNPEPARLREYQRQAWALRLSRVDLRGSGFNYRP